MPDLKLGVFAYRRDVIDFAAATLTDPEYGSPGQESLRRYLSAWRFTFIEFSKESGRVTIRYRTPTIAIPAKAPEALS